MITIRTLRQNNYKVRVIHSRAYENRPKGQQKMDSSVMLSGKGGQTRIDITTPEGITETGIAKCSQKDSFNRRLGNEIALGRALKALQEQGVTFAEFSEVVW